MPDTTFSDQELLAYLDELLPVEQLTSVEKTLRNSQSLQHRLAELAQRRDHGVHSVGEIWRRLRLSCPTRSQLGSYLLGALDAKMADYVEFHIQTVGCRICEANLRDLQEGKQSRPEGEQRRRKFFESSAGYLHRLDEE